METPKNILKKEKTKRGREREKRTTKREQTRAGEMRKGMEEK